MIGDLVSAAGSLIGGLFNRNSAQDVQQQNLAHAQAQMAMQEEFAKKGIRWKVADAKAAGIHPAFALGASTNSYTPVSFSQTADTSMGSALSSMGQDVGRAINATRTAPERTDAYTTAVQGLTLQKMGLENDLLASQVAKLNQAGGNPAIPGAAPALGKDDIMIGGTKLRLDPKTSSTEKATDRWGEGADIFYGPYVAYRDYLHHKGWNSLGEGFTSDLGRLRDWMRGVLPAFGRR